MRIINIFTIALLYSVTAARAAITATFVRSDPTPAAIANDPVLSTMQSWLLRVTYTDGDWDLAALHVTLDAGSFYNHVFGSNTHPNPLFFGVFPALEFDTYVTSPADNGVNGATTLISGFSGGPVVLSGGETSVRWGDLVVTPPGTYTIARLTFPLTSIPTVHPLSFVHQVNPERMAFIPPIPEPSSLGAVAMIGVMALQRRK